MIDRPAERATLVGTASVVVMVALTMLLFAGTNTTDVVLLAVGAALLTIVGLSSLQRTLQRPDPRVPAAAADRPTSSAPTASLDGASLPSAQSPAATAPPELLPTDTAPARLAPGQPIPPATPGAVPTSPNGSDRPSQTPESGVAISGVVTTQSGAGIEAASITVVHASGQPSYRARSDRSGRFELRDIPGGSYAVVLSAQPYAPRIAPVTLAAGHVILNMCLRGTGTVTSRVLGGLDQRPHGGVAVGLVGPDGTVERTTVTNPVGLYRFDEVEEGPWTIVTGAPGYQGGQQDVWVHAGEAIGTDFHLVALGAASGVVASDGYPVPGVSVALVDAEGQLVARDRTDRSGRYRFPGIPEGSYVVVVMLLEPRAYPTLVRVDDRLSQTSNGHFELARTARVEPRGDLSDWILRRP